MSRALADAVDRLEVACAAFSAPVLPALEIERDDIKPFVPPSVSASPEPRPMNTVVERSLALPAAPKEDEGQPDMEPMAAMPAANPLIDALPLAISTVQPALIQQSQNVSTEGETHANAYVHASAWRRVADAASWLFQKVSGR